MTSHEQSARSRSKGSTPGAFSRWLQHRANGRMVRRVRAGRGRSMGMDVLVLHTVGRHSGQPRETPLAWFADDASDGRHAWTVVASGGQGRDPDWCLNLLAGPDRAAVELPGAPPVPVDPQRLDGAARDEAWRRIAEAQPRIAKYQDKAGRDYTVLRLVRRSDAP